MDIEDLEWRCSCGESRPPTSSEYMRLIKQKAHKGHKMALVNKATGEVVATNPQDAIKKGILKKEGEILEGKPVLTSEGMIEYTLTLPPEAFTLYNMAKSFGFVKDSEMDFDQWIFECINRRFSCDYGVKIVLQRVTAAKDDKETLKQLMREVLAESKEG